MSTKDEIERKWFIVRRKGPIPKSARVEEITQDYLWKLSLDVEERLRKSVENGKTTYTYTRKVKTKVVGVRPETEIKLWFIVYILLLFFFRDRSVSTLKKTRYSYYFGKQLFQHDLYEGDFFGYETIEAEVATKEDMDDIITPDFVDCIDVTGIKGYSNYEIAKHGFPKINNGGTQK